MLGIIISCNCNPGWSIDLIPKVIYKGSMNGKSIAILYCLS